MTDPIQGYLDNMKKELIDAGELGPDEKLSGPELQNRYMKFMIKKAQGEMTGSKPKPKAPVAQKVEPAKSPAVASPKKDTPETKMQEQYKTSLGSILASRDRSDALMKQNQDLVMELLSSQDPFLATEFLKLQAWLAKSTEAGMDQKELMTEAQKKVEALQKIYQKKLTRPEDLQERFELLLPKLQKNNAALEGYNSKMDEGSKELTSIFEKNAGGEAK